MAVAVHALNGSFCVFHRGVPAYVPRHDVRFVSKAPRTHLDLWHVDLRRTYGGGLRWIRASVGADVLLGSPSYHLIVWGDPGGG